MSSPGEVLVVLQTVVERVELHAVRLAQHVPLADGDAGLQWDDGRLPAPLAFAVKHPLIYFISHNGLLDVRLCTKIAT